MHQDHPGGVFRCVRAAVLDGLHHAGPVPHGLRAAALVHERQSLRTHETPRAQPGELFVELDEVRVAARTQAPFSGNVDQTINPWTWFLRLTGVEVGQLNVYLGDSSNPGLERQILETVGTYGRQIGQIGDAMAVLLRRTKLDDLQPDERDAIAALMEQLAQVDRLKRQAGAKPLGGAGSSSPSAAGGSGGWDHRGGGSVLSASGRSSYQPA